MAKQLNVNLAFTADTTQAKKQLNDLQKQLTELMQTSTKSGTMNITKEIKEAEHAAASLKAHLSHAINVDTGKLDLGLLNKSFQEAGVNLGYYRQELQKLGLDGEKAFSSLAANILKADVPLKQTNALLQQFATTLKNTARWQISSSLLHGFMGSVQTAYYYAEDLNESLNNIRIVTGQNTEQMARFAKEANEAAKALSTTTTEYTNASLIYYQQGLSDAEVKERTDATVKMANVTRTAAEEVSQQMTAIWNNFADGSKTLEYYSDVVTALGAATASSSAEIAEGLEKFAAVANTVGLSYEYATAALATVTATTRQSADVVGNAFKTLFARLESLKLGDTLDDGTDLNKYSQALAQVGVNIKDTSGQLKNMDTILDELGEKWTTLGKDQQMALASTVAGVRQYTQLIALMENWDFFQENVDVAKGSEGTLQEQADIYAESWEAARDRVKAAAEEIYSQLLNDNFFIKLNDGFADALKGVSKLIEGLGGVKGIISVLSTMMLSLFSKDISNGINNFLYNFRDQKKVAQDMKDRAVGEITGMVGTEYGQYYNMIAEAQESYLLNVNDMSEIEKTIARDLLDQHEARVKNLIDQQQQLEEEQKLLNVENQAVQRKKSKVSNLEQGYLDQASQVGATADQSDELRRAMGGYKQVALLSSRIPKISEIFDAKGIGGAKEIAEKLKGIQSSSKSFSTEIQNALKLLKSGKGNIEEIAQAIDILEKAERKNGSSKESDQEGKLNNTANERLLSAFREIADSEEAAQEAFRKYTASVDDATRAEEGFNEKNDEIQQKIDDLGKSTDEATEATGKLEKSFEEASAPALTFGTTLQGVVQTASSLAMVVNALKGLGDLWSDEEASDGEKILGTLTTFGMVLPIVTNLKNLYNKTSLVAQKNSFKEWLGHKLVAAGLAEEAVAAEEAAATTTMFNIAAGGTIAIMGALALAIGLVVGGVWLLVEAYKASQAASPEGQFKAASKAAEELAKAYDDVKSSYDDLKSSLEDYNNAKTALEEMTEGTLEWKEAVAELNEQVLDLIDKYPQLSSGDFISSDNGYLEISEEGQNKVLESQLERVQTAYQNKLLSQANVSRTSINKDVAELAERSTYKGSNGAYQNAEYLDIPVLPEEIEKVIEVISKEGISITENTDALVEATGINEKHIEAILKNKNELVKLTNKITASREANKVQTTELGKSLVGDTASSQFYDQLTYLIGQRAQEEFSKNPNAKGYSKEEIRTRYAELNNYAHINKDTYLVNGESQEIDLSTAKTAVAMADAQERAANSLAEYTQALQTFQEVSGTGSETILNFVSGLDTGIDNLTKEDIDKLDQFYKTITNGSLSEEDLAFLNFLDEDLLDNLKDGSLGEEFEGALEDIADEVLSSVKDIYDDIVDENSDLTIAGRKAISEALKRSVALGSDDAVEFIKKGFENGGGQAFADLLENITWNTTDLETFKQLLNESGVQFDYSDKELEQLISTMRNLPPVTQDAVTAFKALHDVIDNLANGGTISSEQYEALGGDLYESFFLKMADGSYKLTTDAQSFYDLVNQRSIEGFEQNIDTIKGLMGSYDMDYLTSRGDAFDHFNSEKVNAQLDFLRSSGYEDIDKLAEWSNGELNGQQMVDLTKAVQETAEAVGGLNGALGENMERLASTATNLGELHGMLEKGKISEVEFTKAAMAMDAATDTENLNPDELAEYVEYLQEASDKMEGFNDEMSKDEARIVAKGIMKMNDAIETLSSNWENWFDILDNSTETSEEYMQAMSGSRQAVADLLDISEEYVSSDFITSHFEEIGEAAEGSAEAIDSLKTDLADDIVAKIIVDSNLDADEVNSLYQELKNAIPDVEAGVTLKGDDDFITTLQRLVDATGMTVDQVNALCDGLGFEVRYDNVNVPTEYQVPLTTTHHTREYIGDPDQYGNYTEWNDTEEITDSKLVPFEGEYTAFAISTSGKPPKITGATRKASGSANNHSSSNKGGGNGGGGGKGPSHKDPIKDRPDRYYDINNAISSINEELERNAQLQEKLGALQDHYHGEALIKSLEQENELLQSRNTILESQYSNYEKLYEIQSQELGELKGKIGGEWDGNVLQNYSDLFQANVDRYNAAIEAYNNMSAEEQEASGNQMVEDAKEAYDTYKEALDRYQDLYYNEMYDTENKLAELRQQLLENHLKIIENNLKSWEVKVQLKLDTTKLEREWNKFLHDMETDFRKVYKNLTIDSLNSSSDFMSYLDDVETKMQQIRDVEAEIDKMEAAKNEDGIVVLSDDMMFGSISEAQEKLKELQGELIDANNNLREAYKQTWDNYLEGLEQAAKNFEDIGKKFEHINNQLEYEKELIELIYGDKAYDLMNQYYETQRRNIETQIDSTRQQAEFWEDQFRKAYEMNKEEHGVSLDDMSTWTEDMKKAYDQMISSQEELNNLVIEGIKTLQDEYLNNVAKAFNEMDNAIWGMDFTRVKEDWDFIQKRADEYLDDVESAYKIQTLANKIDMSISETSSLQAQQKLAKLREDEIDYLREKENLTQDDIDLAEARYQIALKEIALEDAQNNKTSMKLTRDTSGNWTYQYVADDEDIKNRQQELLDAYNNLYEIADNAYNHAMNLAMETYEEMQTRMQEIANDMTLTEEQKQQRIQEIYDEYLPLIDAAFENSQLYQQEVIYATGAVFAEVCEQDEDAYISLTDTQKALVDEIKNLHLDDYEEIREAIQNAYGNIKDYATNAFRETNENSKTVTADIIRQWDKGKDSVKEAVHDAFISITQYTSDYIKKLEELEKASGHFILDEGGVVSDIDKIGDAINEVGDDTEEMVDRMDDSLDELRGFVDEVANCWDGVIDKIQEAIATLREYIQTMSDALSTVITPDTDFGDADVIPDNDGGGGGNPGENNGNENTEEESNDNDGWHGVYNRAAGINPSTGIPYVIHRTAPDAKKAEEMFKKDFNSDGAHYAWMNTGGYTGSWGDNSGRLAVLHQKELVLNATDTENMLQTVNAVRDISKLNESIGQTIASAIGNLIVNTMFNTGKNINSSSNNNNTSNVFNITAEFPNADDVQTIRDAILSLPNIASQFVHES